MAAKGLLEGDRRVLARRAARARDRARGPPRQRRARRSSAASPSRGSPEGRGTRSSSCTAASRRSCSCPSTRCRPRSPAGCSPSRCRTRTPCSTCRARRCSSRRSSRAPSCCSQATEDKLHQNYRAEAMPETDRLIRVLRAAGHPAVVSGAGPSILVLASDPSERADAIRLVEESADTVAGAAARRRLPRRDGRRRRALRRPGAAADPPCPARRASADAPSWC